MQPHAQPGWVGTVVAIVIVALVLLLRMRGMNRTRPLKVERLWLLPGFYLMLAVLLFVQLPPTGPGWGYCGAALIVGAVLGWQRGKLMRISVDPATGTLNQSASPAALLFLLVLVAIRSAAKTELGGNAGDAALLTDILVAFALGLLTMQRVEMFLRARRLLAEARDRQS